MAKPVDQIAIRDKEHTDTERENPDAADEGASPTDAAVPEPASEEPGGAPTTTTAHSRRRWRILYTVRSRWRRWPILYTVLGLVTLVLAASTTVLAVQLGQHNTHAELRQSAVQSGQQAATNLTTISAATANHNIDQLLRTSTGKFKDEFARVSDQLRKAVTDSKVDATGEVTAAGASTVDERAASVLVAIRSNVKNTEAPEGQTRNYRLRVSLERHDAQWLISNMEFVA